MMQLSSRASFQPTPSLRRATQIEDMMGDANEFQPTPSLRRATSRERFKNRRVFISTHALLAEGDSERRKHAESKAISTHALLAEGDPRETPALKGNKVFQPTPSLRRATTSSKAPSPTQTNFNPRPPCGGRHIPYIAFECRATFQPTPSLRRATSALRNALKSVTFQPTPSLRRATHRRRGLRGRDAISTHALLAEGDGKLEQ